MANDQIIVHGARVHNLKNITVEIPRDKLVVITGLSGFGQVVAGLRHHLCRGAAALCRVAVGLCAPVPGADGKAGCGHHRRPVAGGLHRPESALPQPPFDRRHGNGDLRSHAPALRPHRQAALPGVRARDQPADRSSRWWTRSRPCRKTRGCCCWGRSIQGRKGEYKQILEDIRKQGFVRARIDGEIYELSEKITLARYKQHTIEVVVDRLQVKPGMRQRLADSLELALKIGKGMASVQIRVAKSAKRPPWRRPARMISSARNSPACTASAPSRRCSRACFPSTRPMAPARNAPAWAAAWSLTRTWSFPIRA